VKLRAVGAPVGSELASPGGFLHSGDGCLPGRAFAGKTLFAVGVAVITLDYFNVPRRIPRLLERRNFFMRIRAEQFEQPLALSVFRVAHGVRGVGRVGCHGQTAIASRLDFLLSAGMISSDAPQ